MPQKTWTLTTYTADGAETTTGLSNTEFLLSVNSLMHGRPVELPVAERELEQDTFRIAA